MVQLSRPKIGTPESAKILYSLHETGSLLVGDLFFPNYITDCIQMVEDLGQVHKLLISKEAAQKNIEPGILEAILARTDDTVQWAKRIRNENYHQIHTLSFLSEWAAQEAGNENVIAAIIETIATAAQAALLKLKTDYVMQDWPWSPEKCLEIAQKLDQKIGNGKNVERWNIAGRLTVLFACLGVSLVIAQDVSDKYNEASMMRNVIVHRYGRLSSNDVIRASHLSEWVGKTVPMTKTRLGEYHQAIIDVHTAILKAILANGWK